MTAVGRASGLSPGGVGGRALQREIRRRIDPSCRAHLRLSRDGARVSGHMQSTFINDWGATSSPWLMTAAGIRIYVATIQALSDSGLISQHFPPHGC